MMGFHGLAAGGLALALMLAGGDWAEVAFDAAVVADAPTETPADDLLWLEEPHGERALAWARQATQQTRQRLAALPSHARIAQALEDLLAQAPPEPDQYLLGPRALRLWRDAQHPHGLLQTAPRDSQGKPDEWTTVLDVGQLRAREGVPYLLRPSSTVNCLPPGYARCLLRLAPAGGDEAEIHEFDLARGGFVQGGFHVGKARSSAQWMGPDRLLIGHTLGDAPRTLAGWAAAFGLWARGQPLSAAQPVFQAPATDAIVPTGRVGAGAQTQAVITRVLDYSTFEISLVDAAGTVRTLPLPRALKSFGVLGATRRHLLVQLAQDSKIEGRPYRAESVLAYDVDTATPEGRRVSTLYQPAEDEFVDIGFGALAAGAETVYLVVTRNLRQRVLAARMEGADTWAVREMMKAGAGETVTLRVDDDGSDDVVVTVAGFVAPRSQYLVRADGKRMLLARDRALIDGSRFVTEIGTARAKDGTPIDYFLLKAQGAMDGPQPLLMTGYGAFGTSFRPGYFDAPVGGPAMKLWLERGGLLAIPAVRGGGERGAAWHHAAMREKRQVSYDDFIAVTEHLIDTGVAQAERIGLFGASNGGLLTATLGTQRPDLFGAVVSDVPLTDLIRMRHMGMGAAWMDEYGDPRVPEQAKAMRAYSPYHNVRSDLAYPPFMVTISTEDNRVGPGHARKFAWRLMEAGATTYFYEDEEGGHGVSDALRNPKLMALRMSFLIDTLMPEH